MDGQDTLAKRTTVVGVAVVVLLCILWSASVFQGGAFAPQTWLPLMAVAAGILLISATAGPVVPSTVLQRLLLGLFVLQLAWTAASLLWADSQANAWEEINRTFFYAIVITLAFMTVRWARMAALKAIAVAVIAVIAGIAVAALVAINTDSDPLSLFTVRRLSYPITYFNGLAAALMIGFWLAVGLASGARLGRSCEAGERTGENGAGHEEAATPTSPDSQVVSRRSRRTRSSSQGFPRWTQPVLLVIGVLLLAVALLPESRAAFWSFFLVLPFFLIFAPHRFRSLANLLTVATPVVLFWDRLNAPYLAGADQAAFADALTTQLVALGYSAALVVGIWAITWLAEYLCGPLRRKVAVWVSVALVSVTILGAAAGVIYADQRTGGLDGYVADRWEEMMGDGQANGRGGTRFVGVGLNGRVSMWKVAITAFEQNPALGVGAQNYEQSWYKYSTFPGTLRQPHSQPMQLLAELGVPGITLWLVFVVAAIVYAARIRFGRATSWTTRVCVAAMITAFISWFIHSSADWLWQLAAVTLPAMILLGGLVGADADGAGPVNSENSATGETAITRSDRQARHTRRASSAGRMWLGILTRGLIALVAIGAIASASFPYLSSRYSTLAAGAADPERALARSDTARWLDPTSLEPYTALAAVYLDAAAKAPSATERLDRLTLAASVYEDALEIEPEDWSCHRRLVETLLAAREAANEAGVFSVTQDLTDQARIHLQEIRRLNPLYGGLSALEDAL